MKYCLFCNEYSCGSAGTHQINEYCGKDDTHLLCVVYSHDFDTALEFIRQQTKNEKIYRKTINRGFNHIFILTKNFVWKWVQPTLNGARGIRPVRAFVDDNISLADYQDNVLPYCIYTEDGYPKRFSEVGFSYDTIPSSKNTANK